MAMRQMPTGHLTPRDKTESISRQPSKGTLADYLAATIDEGIYNWREKPVECLPEGPLSRLHSDNHKLETNPSASSCLKGLVDSDWAADTIKRKSISRIIIMFAGGCIAYKSKYQDVIALSTTEAEFVAACDAGKIILFSDHS